MDIERNGSQPSNKGPAEYFTGVVRVDPLFQAPAPARATGAYVTFEPGARSAWHTDPLGQTLIVTSGVGWTQCWGGPVEEIRPMKTRLQAERPNQCVCHKRHQPQTEQTTPDDHDFLTQ
jgi:hypothetical protein